MIQLKNAAKSCKNVVRCLALIQNKHASTAELKTANV